MQKNDKLILVGFISSCSGIKGDVTVRSYMQEAEDICKFRLFTEDGTELKLKLLRKNTNGNLICRLNNITNRNEAETWVKKKLFCYRSVLPKAADEEFYIEDLKGLKVTDINGNDIGYILDIYNFGAGDIIELKLIDGKKTMLPFTDEFFPEIFETYAVCNNINFVS